MSKLNFKLDEQFNLIKSLNKNSMILLLSNISTEINNYNKLVIPNDDILIKLHKYIIQEINKKDKINISENSIIYYKPINYIKTQIKNKFFAIETDMELCKKDGSKLIGGSAHNIYPLIHNIYVQNSNNLAIKSTKTITIKFDIIPGDNKENEPVYKYGSFTAVYLIENIDKYILRIYEDELNHHLLNNPKIIKEKELFDKYFFQIFYYGYIVVKNDDSSINIFHYIITKLYNMADITNDFGFLTVNNMDNKIKYKLIINILKFLKDLYDQNMFHSDFKLQNIGWDSDMNIIMIDYDLKTLQIADDSNQYIKRDKDNNIINLFNNVEGLYFPTSPPSRPRYVFINNPKLKSSQLNKYSIGGLDYILEALNLQMDNKNNHITLDPSLKICSRNINNIYYNDELKYWDYKGSLNLDSIYYDQIPLYSELIELFEWLNNNGYILD